MLRQFSLVLGAVIFASIADAQPLPSGAVVDDVKCAGDRTQSYALYLPSQYTPDRQWNLLIAFHPAARGAIFATAGTDDFNYLEMRLLDRKLKSPHRLAIFNGGHTLPPDAVALDAIEWMELQAMKSNRRPRSDQLIDRLLADRRALMASASSPVETVHLLEDFVADFTGLRDTSIESRRLKELSQQGDVKKALSRERASDDGEMRMLSEIFELEAGLSDRDRHHEVMLTLRDRLSRLSQKAAAPEETPERSQARRVLRSITAGASGRVQDREYMQLLTEFGMRGRGGL